MVEAADAAVRALFRRHIAAVLAGVAAIVVALTWFGRAGGHADWLLAHGVQIQGRVVEARLFCDGAVGAGCGQRGTARWDPRIVVEFTPVGGGPTRVTIHVGEDSPYIVGESVTIFYSPDDPVDARTREEPNLPYSPAFVAIFSLVGGLVVAAATLPGLVRTSRQRRLLKQPWRPVRAVHWLVRARPHLALLADDGDVIGVLVSSQALPIGASGANAAPVSLQTEQSLEAAVFWPVSDVARDGWPTNGTRVAVVVPEGAQVVSGRLWREGRQKEQLLAAESGSLDSDRLFRPRMPLPVLWAILTAGMGFFAVASPFGYVVMIIREGFSPGIFLVYLVDQAAFTAGTWFCYRGARLRLLADKDGVSIVNFIKTYRFGWDEIDRFEVGGGYWGIAVRLLSGRLITMNAIQKANISTWFRWPTRADRVVQELNGLLQHHDGTAL